MRERTKKGYGRCLCVKSTAGMAGGAGTADQERRTAEVAGITRSPDEVPTDTEGIRTAGYQIVEGWALPCST